MLVRVTMRDVHPTRAGGPASASSVTALLRERVRALSLLASATLLTRVIVKDVLTRYTRTRPDYLEVADALRRAQDGRGEAEQRLAASMGELEGAVTGARELAVAAEFREARTRAVMNSVADGVVVFDRNGIIQSCTPSGERIFKVKPGALLATQLRLLIPSLELSPEIIAVGTREVDGRHIGGMLFPLEVTISPIASDEYPLWIAVVRDVTHRREVATAVAEARDAALQAVRIKSEFLATMSHEIRTPMNGIIGMTELLLDTDLDPQQRTYTEAVQRSGEALLSLINDILDFSKLEAGKLHMEHIDVNVRQVVEDVVELLRDQADRKGLEFACHVDHTLRDGLLGDPSRLRQILLNLVGNAIKFTPSGEVRVRAYVAEDLTSTLLVRFEVTDSGIGIDAETQTRLFAPFVQADGSTTRKYGGTGLGLAICRQLVERMGGRIGVDSAAGQGSTFWFTVAFARGSTADEAQPAQTGVESMPPARLSVVKRTPMPRTDLAPLLVAEDSTINQQVALGMLKKLGLAADVVANGREAVAALARTTYAAVLMDCQMPEMDGFEATSEIRRREGSARHTPIIAMTANAMQGDRERCLAAGMDDYVSKPVRIEELTAALVRRIGRKGDELATVPQAAPDTPKVQLVEADPFDRALLEALPPGLRAGLLVLFFQEVPMRLERVKAAVQDADAAALQAAAHTFKGDAATVGARDVARLCRALEQSAQQDDLGDCEPLVEQLEAALARAQAALPDTAPDQCAA